MTVQEKQLLRRILLGVWGLLHAETKTEAIERVDEIVDAVDQFQAIDEKPAPPAPSQPIRKG